MNPSICEGALSQLEISQRIDSHGVPSWSLDIIDEVDGQLRTAYFDHDVGRWKLKRPTKDAKSHIAPKARDCDLAGGLQGSDWTETLPLSDQVDLFRDCDWSLTPLGPCSTWPLSLRLYTHMVFSDNRVAALYWGPKHITIYNEHMAALGGDLHPGLMSSCFEEALPELWAIFGPLVRTIEENQGGSYAQKGLELPILRYGFVEETWWDGGLVSLKNDQGGHGGVYFTWAESTRTVLRDRRTSLINKMIPPSDASNSLLWHHIYEVFAEYPRDIPMAIIYSVDEEDSHGVTLRLEHTIGTASNYSAAPNIIKVSQVGSYVICSDV